MKKILIMCIICCFIVAGCSSKEKSNWNGEKKAGEAVNQSADLEKMEDTVSDEFVMDKEQPEGFILEQERKAEVPEGFVGIYSVDDLQRMEQDGGQYILMSDLDMSDVKWKTKEFKGTFDGNCHVISHLKSCLFDTVRGQMENLGLEEVDVSETALARRLSDGRINNCYVTGRIHGHSGIVNLIYPRQDSSITIENCYNAAEITNENYDSGLIYVNATGGIAGDIELSDIGEGSFSLSVHNCENYGKINGYEETGGILGQITRGAGSRGYYGEADINVTVSNCFNYGIVCGSERAGGILGGIIATNASKSMKNMYKIRNCANYNEISVSESMGDYIAGAICGTVDLSVNKGYNHMLEVGIQDCLNTSAVDKTDKDGQTSEGGGVCGEIDLNYGTCSISCCLNIGNTSSEYNYRSYVNNSSPIYVCTDYYTEHDMPIRDMKNISKNLPSFSYPDIWGIDSLYSGFPHPYGSEEQEEVWSYYEQKRQKMADTMLENADESELILMQRYADMLASMGLGGYWPEDKEHNSPNKYLLEYYDDVNNYYAVTDVDGDGQKELLLEISGSIIYIYRYDLESGEISKEETQENREEFEQSHGDVDEIQWLALKSSNYQAYSQAYMQYYMERLKKDMSSDVGAEYVEKKTDGMEFIKKISNDYGLEFKEVEADYEYAGYDGQEVVFSMYMEDGGGLNYQGKQINGATVFGLYPGMKEKKAGEVLSKYGFLQKGEGSYFTGGAPGNYFVYLTVENGVVKAISIYQGSLYVG